MKPQKWKIVGKHGKKPKGHRCTKLCSLKCMCGKTIHVEAAAQPEEKP